MSVLAQGGGLLPTQAAIIGAYLVLLIALGVFASRLLQKTGGDYFLASRGIGPFMLLMSLFGTTMTAFALIGSSGRTFVLGVGVYGLMASWSGIVHPLVFFLVGAKVWSLGKRYGYLTQLSYFRDRFRSNTLALLLFPLMVSFVMAYILMGAIGAGLTLEKIAGIPYAYGVALVCAIVLIYVFFGGMRATAWANTAQTLVFMVMGAIAFIVIMQDIGGAQKATRAVLDGAEEVRRRAVRDGNIAPLQFLTYGFIPLSVGMFPHLFQHWLTAKRASNFKLTVSAFPICIMITWVPCVLIGFWAAAELPSTFLQNENAVLPAMVARHSGAVLSGLIGAGILAAMMSSMDSQFLCVGSMFTNDIVRPYFARADLDERRVVWIGRGFVIAVVAVTYVIALTQPRAVFGLGVWCFTGFASLFPILLGGLYWKRANKYGAIAAVVTVGALWLWFLGPATEGHGFLLAGVMPVTWILLASTVVFVVGSLLTPRPPADLIAKFFG